MSKIMSNEYSIQNAYPIIYYRNKALSMLNIYDPNKEGYFCDWLNKFEFVADRIKVPNDKMIEFFKNMVSYNVHLRVKMAFFSVNFYKLEYQKLINIYLQYFASTNEIDFHKTRLLYRIQYNEETIEQYVANLRKIFHNCCSTSTSEKELCKQFVEGIRDNYIRARLIKIPNLSFDEMIKKAIEFEGNNQMNDYVNEALKMINIFNLSQKGFFYQWLNKFEFIADFIGVPNNKMIEFFNKMIDNNIHKNVKEKISHDNFLFSPYEKIINYYIFYLDELDEVIFHRKRFMCRYQYKNETITKYADNLTKIRNLCFITLNSEDFLLKQFLTGIHNDELRIHLNRTPCYSFDKIVAEAIAFEKAYEMTRYKNEALKIINIFNPTKEVLFHEWLNKFERAANIIGVSNERMIEFFNEMIDNDVRTAVMQTFPGINFSELSYEQIINHYHLCFSVSCKSNLNNKLLTCQKQYKKGTIEKSADNLEPINNKEQLKEGSLKQVRKGIRSNEIKEQLDQIPNLSLDKMAIEPIKFDKSKEISTYVTHALLWMSIYEPKKNTSFCQWYNKFEYIANMIEVPEDKMIEFFNELVDNDVHKQVKEKYSSKNFSELSYDEILKHYIADSTECDEVYFHRTRFRYRYQYEGETIENYYQCLRNIYYKALHSNWQTLRNQFIKGILDDEIRTTLSKFRTNSCRHTLGKAIELENLIKEKKKL